VGAQHVRLPGHEPEVDLALELELLLELMRRRHHLAGPREVHGYGTIGGRWLDPPGRHHDVAALQQLAQPLAELALDAAELEHQLELGIVIAMVHGADLDPQPPAEHRPVGRAESRHASRHRL